MRKDKENPTLLEQLDELLDEAIGEGRQNWDGYYDVPGEWNNSYHMESVKNSDEYQAFVRRLRILEVAHVRRL